jgi:hypothetical protein
MNEVVAKPVFVILTDKFPTKGKTNIIGMGSHVISDCVLSFQIAGHALTAFTFLF